MIRRIAIVVAAAAALAGGALAMPRAEAAGVCVTYDVTINDQHQAGEQCTPELPGVPSLP